MAIGRKTLGLRSFFADFSQAFVRPIWRRYQINTLKRFCPDIYHAQRLFTLNDKLKTTNGKRLSPPYMLIT